MAVLLAAVVAGVVAGVVAALAPRPTDFVGAIAVGGVAALAVVVGYLATTLRDRDRRLERIERRLEQEADRGRVDH